MVCLANQAGSSPKVHDPAGPVPKILVILKASAVLPETPEFLAPKAAESATTLGKTPGRETQQPEFPTGRGTAAP